MLLFKKVEDIQRHISSLKIKQHSVGFVPTMGALHEGHLSLIKQSKAENKYTVCSIFVNPTQFNDKGDLDKYPRTTAKDIELLTSVDCDILFLPPVEEVYPPGLDIDNPFDFGQLATVMEGQFRPGHFDGMAQVVKRLLDIVMPNYLYMGQKDFQQLTIVRNMLTQMKADIKLRMCAIIREDDGLAMSSRNVRLEKDIREKAPIIFHTLKNAQKMTGSMTPDELKEKALASLSLPNFKPEYFEIVDGVTLLPIQRFEDTDFAVACVAVWAGDVRLIDNMVLKQPKS